MSHVVRKFKGIRVYNYGQPFPSVSHNQCASPPSLWHCSRCRWDACGAEWCVQGFSCPANGVGPPCSPRTTRTVNRNRMGINKDCYVFISNQQFMFYHGHQQSTMYLFIKNLVLEAGTSSTILKTLPGSSFAQGPGQSHMYMGLFAADDHQGGWPYAKVPVVEVLDTRPGKLSRVPWPNWSYC